VRHLDLGPCTRTRCFLATAGTVSTYRGLGVNADFKAFGFLSRSDIDCGCSSPFKWDVPPVLRACQDTPTPLSCNKFSFVRSLSFFFFFSHRLRCGLVCSCFWSVGSLAGFRGAATEFPLSIRKWVSLSSRHLVTFPGLAVPLGRGW